MSHQNLNELYLKTAFSCMACDGDIDDREVQLIHKLSNETNLFGDLDVNTELNALIERINKEGMGFLRSYLQELKNAELSAQNELSLLRAAIETIHADERVEYGEIKFFKLIREELNVPDEQILENIPEIEEEYLEKDIFSESYLQQLKSDFFENQQLPQFETIQDVSGDNKENSDE